MRLIACLAAAAFSTTAGAADFRTVGEAACVMYDAPSRASTPIFVASRHYPLEVIVNLDAWVKVRDHAGTLSWVERKALSDRRMVIVTAPSAEVRTRPDDASPAAFLAGQNVALEVVEIAAGGWARVRHADGSTGYVKAGQVWGL